MRVLGISAFYHDSAAALVIDGAIAAAAQEERFSRKKHDARFPRHAVEWALRETNTRAADLDAVVFYDKPFLKFERLLETYLALAPRGFNSFRMALPLWVQEKLFQKNLLAGELADIAGPHDWASKLLFTEHHMSHGASAFYPSPFEEAVVLTMDGVGEWATTSVAIGRGAKLDMVREIHFPHSLGLLYSAFTYYTGFKVNSGEYKLMGLAPYGVPRYKDKILSKLIDVKADGSFRLDLKYFDYCTGLRMTNRAFDDLFGQPARTPEQLLTQFHMDIAASVQAALEEIVLTMTRALAREFGIPNLCLAGGVALNCVANGKILRDGAFERLWIQPASGDAGGALGAALSGYHQHLQQARAIGRDDNEPYSQRGVENHLRYQRGEDNQLRDKRGVDNQLRHQRGVDKMSGAYLGPSFSQEEIEAQLTAAGARYTVLPCECTLVNACADALANERALGWFQGRMEFGPRALGARSILADPRSPRMQSTLNLKVKYRESFRPFAPSVLSERVAEYFDLDPKKETASPYMLLVADVVADRRVAMTPEEEALFGIDKLNVPRSDIPAVTHVDYSARVQTVHRETNPLYHRLLSRFEEKTGCAVLVNTSFNVRGEPIVGTPTDAFRCFMGTEIEALAVGRCFLRKEDQDPALLRNYQNAFELD